MLRRPKHSKTEVVVPKGEDYRNRMGSRVCKSHGEKKIHVHIL
jgi:hypothetical protein